MSKQPKIRLPETAAQRELRQAKEAVVAEHSWGRFVDAGGDPAKRPSHLAREEYLRQLERDGAQVGVDFARRT